MKNSKTNIMIAMLLSILLFNSGLYAQKKDNDKKAVIRQLVENRNYVFKVQTVQPMQPSPNRQITSDYDLKISPDTVISYLPYFGRAYVAPIDPSQGGIKFTSTKFEYTSKERKKGGWDILIKPQDTQEARQLVLTVSDNGYATLQVLGNNRQPISYGGYIDEKKGKR
ncbi:MAG TPA: DUF4251 domain-containing protein [Chitinophaga sp.]|nr:DUF4251 domain-containing protein [Chitinophaga sp.]